MTAYANTSSNVKVAQKIKKKPNIGLPRLEAWNYDACIHHDTPKANCEYRLCGNDFFAHQRVSIAWLYAIKKGLLASSPGTGKAQPVDCKVLTPSGWRRIGDLVPGDEVYEPNRRITKVKAIHPQGLQPYYNITMTDKSKTQATPDHLWKVRRGSDGPFFICTTEQLREEIKTRPMLQLPPTFVPGVGHVAREIFAIQKPNGGAWAECVCIELESEKQLYLTDDYIVTHNTNVILGLLCLLKQQNEIPRRSLIIVNTPSVKQWQAEAARFAPGLKVAAIPGGTKKSERIETYGGSWDVLIIGFHMMLKDMDLLRKINPSALLTDDVDPLLNDSTKVHQAITELSEDLDRVVVSNASSVGTDLIQLHSSMKPIGGKYIWGPKAAFEDNFIQKEWERIKVGTTVTTDAQGRRVSKPKYVSKSKVRGVKNAPQPVDSPVLTPSGWRQMGDIAVGDFVIGSSGQPVKVIGKTDVTKEPVFKVILSRGQWAEATADHLWAVEQLQVSAPHQNRRRVVKTKDLMKRKKGYCLPLYAGFYSGTYKPAINPYLVGLLLGDGSMHGGKCGVTVGYGWNQEESLKLLGLLYDSLPEDGKDYWKVSDNAAGGAMFVNIRRTGRERTAPSLCTCGRPAYTLSRSLCASCYQLAWQKDRLTTAEPMISYENPLISALKKEGVYGYVRENKRFPWQMLDCSYEDRLSLLQGLMDSDGSMSEDRGRATFTNRSKDLVDGVAALARSFGLGFARWEFINKAGNLSFGVHVSSKKAHPMFRLPYKLAAQMRSYEPYTSRSSRVVSVEPSRVVDVQCLMVDSEDHLYVTKDYILTHNSILKETLDPWYIRYTYDDISDVAMPEVAPVTTVWLTMHKEQRKKYDELRAGVLKLTKDGHEEIKDVQALQMFAQPLNAKVLTPEGWSTIGNIKIGDSVSTPGGGSAKVTGKSVVREAEVFRVTLMDGSTTLASGDHLWEVNNKTQSKGKGRYTCTRVLSTNDLLEDYIQQYPSDVKNNVVRYKYSLPKADSVNLEDVDLPVDPYVMGALLGDGRLGKHGSVTITSSDDFILDTLCASFDPGFLKYTKTLKKNGVFSRKPCWDIIFSKNVILPDRCLSCLSENYVHYSRGLCRLCYDKHTRAGTREQFPKVIINPLIEKISTLGLKGATASEKFVPEVYKNAGFNQRLEILRGLMDTDGSLHSRNNATFSSVSRQLRDDVADLARSLGGYCCKYEYPADNTSGVVYLAHVVTPMNPFKIKRKADRWSPHTAETQKIVKIESVGHMEVQCIMVDSERHLYITDDYMVTHNTYGQMLTAGLPVLGEEDGPGKSVKFDWFCSQVQQEWSDEKVICFVRNKKAIAALKARLDKMGIGCAEVTGNKVGDERQAEITRFWEDENCRVIFCSAAGVRSLNLQCARIVCFLDIPSLNPESVHQAVGRARRAGGHDRVYPFFVMCEDTQEDKYEEVLQQRETISRWVWESEDHLLPKMSAREILQLILP